MNRRRQACDGRQSQYDQIPEPRARGHDHDHEHDTHDQRCPQVRLLVNEQDRYPREGKYNDKVPRKHCLLAAAVHGDHEDQREGCELRRLHLEGSNCKPALCPERDVAEVSEHCEERHDDEAIDHIGPLLEPVIVDQCHHHHHDEADAKPDKLALQVELRVSSNGGQLDTRRRIDHDRANEREQHSTADQDEVTAAHQIPSRVPFPAIAPPSRHARVVGGHDWQG